MEHSVGFEPTIYAEVAAPPLKSLEYECIRGQKTHRVCLASLGTFSTHGRYAKLDTWIFSEYSQKNSKICCACLNLVGVPCEIYIAIQFNFCMP